jgi:predicted phage baseplate assembly protein
VIIDDNHTGRITAATTGRVTVRPRTAYTISGKTTQIELSRPWWRASAMASLRETIVYVETEKLALAMAPDTAPVAGRSIDLQALYGGLPEGRWVIVSGELADIPGTSGVKMAELALVVKAEHISDPTLSGGDKPHTRITFDKELGHSFKRDTVTIYGNIVKATHGDSRKEVLGSGDGAKALQSFALKQPPLTFVSASNPSGIDSTLRIFVNDIQWRGSDTLAGLAATDRKFVTKTDDDGNTTVVFGNGREGARLPTGIENVKAEYRSGIGKAGNVKAEQISLLTTRPLGVREVINPLKASGGADRETRDQARNNAPLAVMALDRLVSVKDYEDFSRIYAGIGKAQAVKLSDGRRQLVYVTVAGIDDMPINKNSDLYRNLHRALLDFGDPYQTVHLEIRESMLIVLSAGIRILPDYQWEPVVTQLRCTLLDAFSFERRELGQDVLLSEVVSVMQRVPGVAYVDVDAFGGIPELMLDGIERRLLKPEEISEEVVKSVGAPEPRISVNLAGYEKNKVGTIAKDADDIFLIHPAQIAFITPEVPETLILNQIA